MNKEELMAVRDMFFKSIFDQIKKPPNRIDFVLQQASFYICPNEEKSFYEPEAGDLAICIEGEFFEKKFIIYYSIWQLGDMLRVGVKIEDEELQGAFASDTHNEVFYIWGMKNDPRVDVAHGAVFYDWEFEVADLYDSYKNQEKFILGTRHMHFRVMRMIHDECQRLFISKRKNRNFEEDSFKNTSEIEDFEKLIDNEKS